MPANKFVFCFGRYSPPTIGHARHFEFVRQYAQSHCCAGAIYVSATVNNTTDPMAPDLKVAVISDIVNGEFPVTIAPKPEMFQITKHLVDQGYTDLVYVAGGDYFDDDSNKGMLDRLQQYAKSIGASLEYVKSGERVEGVSGTALREAARSGDWRTFFRNSPIGVGSYGMWEANHVMQVVQQAMLRGQR